MLQQLSRAHAACHLGCMPQMGVYSWLCSSCCAASSAAGMPLGSLPPAVARLGLPPPPPPHILASFPAIAPAFKPCAPRLFQGLL